MVRDWRRWTQMQDGEEIHAVSVSVALAALAVGARGETHRQLFRGLVFNSTWLSQTDVDQAFQSLFEKTKKANEVTSEGTAVFMDNLFKPQPEFLDTLKKSYFADGFNVDFTKSSESANTINKYVEEKTSGKIDKLVESLDPTTVMYLISYIYFKGNTWMWKWETPFDPDLTKEDLFMVDEKTKVPVQMMNIEKRFETYRDQMFNTSVLHLPFKQLSLHVAAVAGRHGKTGECNFCRSCYQMAEMDETQVWKMETQRLTLGY
ncbi:Alpha-1-antiproteinase S [Takifugu flavidus]|uniref:Thyroxine-binding globulin n=1 Tax=Takifugu flavidus TaxID=433684 RepID=A0A5C6ME94_9TELE|nr:Alpha-1-antiproteinase S [Takifugu flavidus]